MKYTLNTYGWSGEFIGIIDEYYGIKNNISFITYNPTSSERDGTTW